jgi:hypothetical protein
MLKGLIAFVSAGAVFFSAAALAEETNKTDAPDPRIGAEVNSICFARTINGWKALKGVDNVVLLAKGANDWFYVEVQGYCPSRIFRAAETIGIESRPSGGCVTRGDVIIVRDAGHFTSRCYITRMSVWDDKAQPDESDEKSSPEDDPEAE